MMRKTIPLFLILLAGCTGQQESEIKEDDTVEEGIRKIVEQINEPVISKNSMNLIEFCGHKPDEHGTRNFQEDIQNAIDELAEKGGGKLIIPHPNADSWIKQLMVYRIKGPIVLKSGVELSLHPSIKLFFEFEPESYLENGKGILGRYEGTMLYSFSPCIRAFNAENIAITFYGGNGALPVIDGDGYKWQKWSWEGDQKVMKNSETPTWQYIREVNENDVPIAEREFVDPGKDFLRPRLIEFLLCKNIKIEGVKLVNSPFWVVHPVFCESCIFRNIMFDAQVVNNDGIDPESSRNVLIENVIFDNHDDNVAVKSGMNREGREGSLIAGTELEGIDSRYINNGRIGGPSENIVVRNCVFKGHYGFCCGSDVSGGIKNVYVIDNIAPIELKMGAFFKSSRKRGGTVENVYIRNLKMNIVEADVCSIIPNYDGDVNSKFPSTFKNIHIENVAVKKAGRGIRIHGWADAPVENVTVKNVHVEELQSKKSKEIFLINQVKNVVLENVKLDKTFINGSFNRQDSTSVPPKQG